MIERIHDVPAADRNSFLHTEELRLAAPGQPLALAIVRWSLDPAQIVK